MANKVIPKSEMGYTCPMPDLPPTPMESAAFGLLCAISASLVLAAFAMVINSFRGCCHAKHA